VSPGSLDINCDCGESFGKWTLGADEELIPRITTASVACGWHAGDPATMRATVELAVAHGVAVGAHPGMPDLLGFGRRAMDLAPGDLREYVVYQAGALEAFLRPHGRRLAHVKPHGALYPMLNARADLAEAAVAAFFDVMDEPVLYWPAGSDDRALPRACAAAGVRVVREYYPDSRYGADGETVVEHSRAPADLDAVEAAFRRFLESGEVETVDGGTIRMEAESVCVHGDGPSAVAIVDRVASVMEELGRPLRPATARAGEGVSA
jgi:5-oxoprolinase (ATP-hydrolysing) subunit A